MSEVPYHIDQRRIRANQHIRELAATVTLSHLDFIQPLFIDEGVGQQTPIAALTGINSDTVESAIRQIEADIKTGITKFLIFPVPKEKRDSDLNFDFAVDVIRKIKGVFGDRVWLATDVCLCAFTSHGHCGILNADQNRVDNDATIKVLSSYALLLAMAGADCIAPSDLMDGRVKGIRAALNSGGFDHVSILSYAAKFSSAYYGPFRDACKSTPSSSGKLKDRKTYQLSPFNAKDAVATAIRDREEGADILMVKPALLNVDIIVQLKTLGSPLAAYHVSGEYQSIELLVSQNIIQRDKGHVEVWAALKRAGADCIISYAARFSKAWIEAIEY